MDSESEIISLTSQMIHLLRSIVPEPNSELKSLITQIDSVDLNSQPKPESVLISVIKQLISFASTISDSKLSSFITQMISLLSSRDSSSDPKQEAELLSLITQIYSLGRSMHWSSEPEEPEPEPEFISLVVQLTSLISSMDLASQPKSMSKLMSLTTQTISLAGSISDSEPEWELISLIAKMNSLIFSIGSYSDPKQEANPELKSIIIQIICRLGSMDSNSKLRPLITQIFSLVKSSDSDMDSSSVTYHISLSPQFALEIEEGKLCVRGKVQRKKENKGDCGSIHQRPYKSTKGGDFTHFRCTDCNSEDHEEFEKALVEVKHLLHPKHSLRLVLWKQKRQIKECYCCDEDLMKMFYYCAACDCAMGIACVGKSPVLAIKHPRWHEHTLALFPRCASLTCNVCVLADSSSPIYMCPPCDFVVHLKCLNLPRVIRISRHPHRISYTPSFDQGDWSCGICRKKIVNDYGSYFCIRSGCSYAAHSKCATQSNVWDGEELEGVPEEIEEEIEPFVTISKGIIHHFSHPNHHLRLDEHTDKDYEENKQCQACITPIYFGNYYYCMQCNFIHHIVPLTLVGRYGGVMDYYEDNCSACLLFCTTGFFYECTKEGCCYKLHVQYARISEPLLHESHVHPLFLTSIPGEWRRLCCVCRWPFRTKETINCIECDFALCFDCATIPHKVRYKHDKHMLTLSYGNETSDMSYWCEICEKEVYMGSRFYTCDEYCCVTLHIKCLIGEQLYMKLGSSGLRLGKMVTVLPNNHHMSRYICSKCEKRCLLKIAFQFSGLIFCSMFCVPLF